MAAVLEPEQFQESVKRFSVRNCEKQKDRAVRRFREMTNRPIECPLVQVRRVSTKFWPLALVQLSWLVDTIRQLKLTAV
jgi:hypothetical protein